jgi:predicted acyl esterase
MIITKHRVRGIAILAAAATGVGLATLVTPSVAATAVPSATCAKPTFANGISQSVFSADSSTWIRGEAWVQTPDDSDHDGVLDRVHVDITRPAETANPTCHYKAPVIFEDSPYYAGIGPEPFWSVDHELGHPPASRPPVPPWTPRVTTPIISTIYESTWLPRGFAVVHAESPGTGESTGCPTSGGPNETNAGKAVVDWLNGRVPAFTSPTSDVKVGADWTTGNVGMIGTSYNGTLPEMVASTGVEGLKAIVPISAISDWYDYYRANGMVRAPFTFQGEDLDILADVVYSRADQQICRPVIDNLAKEQDRATGDFSPFWAQRDSMLDVGNVHAAALVAHGNNDFNVMTKNMAQFYEAIKKQHVPHMLYFHQGGHGGAPPDVFINLWFSRYLFGVHNGVEKLPRAWVVREPDACPVRQTTAMGDQSNTATLTVADSHHLTFGLTPSIPITNADGTVTTVTRDIVGIPDGTHILLSAPVATSAGQKVSDGATISLQCATRLNPVPYAEWPDPGSRPVSLSFTAGAPGIGGLSLGRGSATTETLTDNAFITAQTSAEAATSNVRLLYQTPVLNRDVHISGTPWLSLRMAFSKPAANLTGVLVDYAPDGTATILTRGWLDPQNRSSDSVSVPMVPGRFYNLRFDMQPKDSVIVAGHRIGVMILSSDNEATIRPAPGTQLTMDLHQSHVQLPIVGGDAVLSS